MCETPFLFDEFLAPFEEITLDSRHQKRVRIEPLVFDILKRKYSAKLDAFWENYLPPKDSDKCILILEPRIHSNLEFVLKNAAYFSRGWSLCFVCSQINERYCRAVAGKHAELVHFLPALDGNLGREEGRKQYSDLLKNPAFYASLPWNHLLLLQTDTYIRKPLPDTLFQYDYVASPTSWNPDDLVGGVSYRRKNAMVEICSRFHEDIFWEDSFISQGSQALGLRRPAFDEALDFFAESCFSEDPVAVHQWWTFFTPGMEDAQFVLDTMFKLEVKDS